MLEFGGAQATTLTITAGSPAPNPKYRRQRLHTEECWVDRTAEQPPRSAEADDTALDKGSCFHFWTIALGPTGPPVFRHVRDEFDG